MVDYLNYFRSYTFFKNFDLKVVLRLWSRSKMCSWSYFSLLCGYMISIFSDLKKKYYACVHNAELSCRYMCIKKSCFVRVECYCNCSSTETVYKHHSLNKCLSKINKVWTKTDTVKKVPFQTFVSVNKLKINTFSIINKYCIENLFKKTSWPSSQFYVS